MFLIKQKKKKKEKEGVQLLRPHLLKAHWALEVHICTFGTSQVSESCCITSKLSLLVTQVSNLTSVV